LLLDLVLQQRAQDDKLFAASVLDDFQVQVQHIDDVSSQTLFFFLSIVEPIILPFLCEELDQTVNDLANCLIFLQACQSRAKLVQRLGAGLVFSQVNRQDNGEKAPLMTFKI
jgi:hypothetical protein